MRGRLWMTFILALSTSSPLPETRCPSTTSSYTIKWDFSQLNISRFLTQTSRILVKWARQLLKSFQKTEKSSMKTSKLSPRKSEKIVVMHHWNDVGVLHSPNDIRLKVNVPKGHVNVFFSWSSRWIVIWISIQEEKVTLSYQMVQDLVDER